MKYRAAEIATLDDYRLKVLFQDGTGGIISLGSELFRPMFEPLRDPSFFAKAAVDKHGAICWPNGADLAPDALYEDIRSAQNEQSPSSLSPGSSAPSKSRGIA